MPVANATTTLQCTSTSVMSQDAVTTAAIPVDAESPSPVAPFRNPYVTQADGSPAIEALAIVNGALAHVRRNLSSDSGWEAVPPFGAQAVLEVAAGTAYALSSNAATFGFFQDGTTLQWTQLDAGGTTWTAPVALPTHAANLKVTYTHLGGVILYGTTDQGSLLLAYQQGSSFEVSVVALSPVLLSDGDYGLCMTDESTWWLAANSGGTPYIFTGTLGDTAPATSEEVTAFAGLLDHVELAYFAPSQNTTMFAFVDTAGQLHVWALGAASMGPVIQPIPNMTVSAATGHVSQQDGTLHLYSLDSTNTLWVLHQSASLPWNNDGTPNWSPAIALDTQILALASDLNPADAPTLFAVNAADAAASLMLYEQDPVTQMWSSGPLQQSAATITEVVRFRTEIAVFDQYANPLPYQAVSVQVAPGGSATDLWVAGTVHPVSTTTAASLTTDAYGKLTVATLVTTGMATPDLVVSATGLSEAVTVQPAAPLHTYLSGTGTLNPTNPGGANPTFDAAGQTLTGAQVGGSALAPGVQGNSQLAAVAAQAIRSTAQVGLNQTPRGLTGYTVDVSDPSNPIYCPATSAEDLRREVDLLRATALPGSFWSDLDNWAGDLWQGIKNGVCALKTIVVDVVNKVVTLAVQIGDAIAQGIQIAITGIEQAAQAVAGFFQMVAAEVQDVIDWLKALFDFAAIWRTKEAFQQAIEGLPPIITTVVNLAANHVNTFFQDQEATINTKLQALQTKYGGQSLSGLPHFQTPGKPPDATTPVAGSATTADFNNNVHHNWMQDKMTAYAPSDSPVTPANTLESPYQLFVTSAEASGTDFVAALQGFAQTVQVLATDPLQIGTLGVSDFLGGIQKLVDSGLSLADAVAEGFLALVDAGITVIVDMLTSELELGPINALWSWMAEAAGSSDTSLTLSALLSLLAAFPCTVIYKLIEGVDEEPFRDGTLPITTTAAGLGAAPGAIFQVMPFGCQLSASILQILYAIPAAIGDYIGAKAPWYLTLATVSLSLAMFVLQHGLPQLTGEEWGLIVAGASGLAMTMPILGFLLSGFKEQLTRLGALISQNSGDIMALLFTLYGVVRFLIDIVDWAEDDPPVLTGVAGLLLPVPSAFAWMQMSVFRDDEEWAPIFQVASAVMDVIGYVGGGVCQLVELCLQHAEGGVLMASTATGAA